MSEDDPFDIPAASGGEEESTAAVDEAVEVVFSDENIENTVLSNVDDETAKQMLQIARKYNLEENDPSWLFAHVLVTNKLIAETAANNSAIAADEAQSAVMRRFEDNSSEIAYALKKALKSALFEFKSDFDKVQQRLVQSLEHVADDFENRKVGIKQSTIVVVAVLMLTSVLGGWWLGANSIQRLQNDQLIAKAEAYDHILTRYDLLTDKQQQAIDKLLLD
jgi:hypothetical protein